MTYRYDPELMSAAAASPRFDMTRPASARALLADLTASVPAFVFPDSVVHSRKQVATSEGSSVTVHVIRQTAAMPSAPAVLWFHGGGFVFGDASMDFPLHVRLARELGAVIVSVEYSLAPENPYPAAVEEGYAVLEWIHAASSELGIDPSRIAVGGHSAGGCLAAAVVLMTRDRRGPSLCLQVLDLPVTDDRLLTPSMVAYVDTPVWTWANAEASWTSYLGPGRDGATVPYAAPSRAADLGSLPPAYVSVAQFDPLRDEGIDYAQRLVQAGVSTELHLFPGTFHGSVAAAPDAAVSASMVEHLIGAVGRAFAPPAPAVLAPEPAGVSV